MALARVDSAYDIAALTAEQEKFLSLLKESKAAIIDLQSQRVTAKGTDLSSFTAATQELNKAINATTVSTQAAANANVAYVAAIRDNNKALEQNIDFRNRAQNSLDSYVASQKDDLALLKSGTISRSEYNKRITESTIKIEEYKNKIKEVSKEIALQTQTEGQRAAAAVKAAAAEKKVVDDLANDYKQLSLAYNESALRAKNLALTAPGSAAAKSAAADAKALGDRLKEVDASVGQNQRNVGNYAGSLGGYFNKILGPLRTLANIIPGLGLGGIFLAAFEAISSVVSKTDELTRSEKILIDVNKKASDSSGEQIAKLELYRRALTNLSVPEKDRNLIREKYNKIAGENNKLSEKELSNIDAINKKITEQIALVERQSLAKAAEAKLGESASAVVKAQLDFQQSLQQNSLSEDQVKASIEAQDKLGIATQKNINTTLDGFKRVQTSKGISDKFQTDSDKLSAVSLSVPQKVKALYASLLAAQSKFKTDADLLSPLLSPDSFESSSGAGAEKSKKKLSDQLNTQFEIYKLYQNRLAKIQDEISNDETNSYEIRISALNNANAIRLKILDKEESEEKRKSTEKLNNTISNLELEKKKGADIAGINREIQRQRENSEQELNLKLAGIVEARNNILDANEKQFTAIEDKKHKARLAAQKKAYDDALKQAEENRNNTKAALDIEYKEGIDGLQSRFDQGKISQREYNKERLRLDFDYGVESLKIEIKHAKDIITIRALLGQDISKEAALLAELERKLANAQVDHTKKTQAQIREEYLKTFNDIQKYSTQAFNLIGGLLNADLVSQKNALREQQDAAEKKAARDIDIVNASADSEEQKAARITIINARLAAQKDAIARQEKEAEYRKAKFDKARAIFEIVLGTAIAVATAIDPISKVIAAVSGATQLAVAIATPIPKYKHGRGATGVEEIAYTGDGGVSEYIVSEDGSIRKTPAVETLTHLMPKDRVLPNKQALMRELAIPVRAQSGGSADVEKLAARIEDAVSSIQITTTAITKDGWRTHNQRLAEYNRWVNTKIRS